MNTIPFSVSSPKQPSDFTPFIPSIHSKPVKFLVRIIDGSISERKSLDELEKKLLDSLNIIIHPALQAPKNSGSCSFCLFLVSGGSNGLVSKFEQKASVYIQKWPKFRKL